MAELLTALNFSSLNIIEVTALDADVEAGQNQFTVQNPSNFSTNRPIRIGDGERAEIHRISNITGNQITITANLSFKHKKFERVIRLRGDQVEFYRASNVDGTPPNNATYNDIGIVTIQADVLETEFTDPDGGSDYWYKFVYVDSFDASKTDLAQAVPNRGGDYGHYCTIDDIRREAGFGGNTHIPNSTISDVRDDAESEVKGALIVAGYKMPLDTVPPVVRNITKRLAAGYLLLQDYGVGAENSTAEGNSKVELANKLLTKIQNREIKLLNVVEIGLGKDTAISGYPDNTVEPPITMDKVW